MSRLNEKRNARKSPNACCANGETNAATQGVMFNFPCLLTVLLRFQGRSRQRCEQIYFGAKH